MQVFQNGNSKCMDTKSNMAILENYKLKSCIVFKEFSPTHFTIESLKENEVY